MSCRLSVAALLSTSSTHMDVSARWRPSSTSPLPLEIDKADGQLAHNTFVVATEGPATGSLDLAETRR